MAFGWVNNIAISEWGEIGSNNIIDVMPGFTLSPGGKDIVAPWGAGLIIENSANKPKMIVCHGGGHTDGGYNILVAFNYEADVPFWFALPNSQSAQADCLFNAPSGVYPDNKPSATHGYHNCLFDPVNEQYILYGRPGWWSTNADGSRDVDSFDLATDQWLITDGVSDLPAFPNVNSSLDGVVVSDPVSGDACYFSTGATAIVKYSAASQTHSLLAVDLNGYNSSTNICYDTLRDRAVLCGAGRFAVVEGLFSTELPAPIEDIVTTGDPGGIALQSQGSPGLVYVPEIDRYIGWDGGQSLFVLHPETFVWSTLPTGGSAPLQSQPNGTYGRFVWSSAVGCLMVVNGNNEKVHAYRLDLSLFPDPPIQTTGTFIFQSHEPVGGNGWSNGQNLLSDLTTTSSPIDVNSKHRVFNSNSPGVPAGATIKGLQFYFESVDDSFPDGGTTPGGQVSPDGVTIIPPTPLAGKETLFTGFDETNSFGASNFTGGRAWTPEEVNSPDFSVIVGIESSADGFPQETRVRKVSARIYYQLATSSVSNTALLQWTLLSSALKQSVIQWAINQPASNSLNVLYGVLNKVENPIQVLWNFNKTVISTNAIVWGLLENVFNQKSLVWHVLGGISASNQLEWDILAVIGNNAQLQWNVLSILQNSYNLKWEIRERTSNSTQLEWSLQANVNQNISLHWDILSSLASVGNTVDLHWNLQAQISNSVRLHWELLQSVGIQADLVWSILESLTNTIQTEWDVTELAQNNTTLSWSVLEISNNQIALHWKINSDTVQAEIRTIITSLKTGTIVTQVKQAKIITH